MEDALVQTTNIWDTKSCRVLILVLMEDALVHQDRREFRKTEGGVLILVLMEDALVPE